MTLIPKTRLVTAGIFLPLPVLAADVDLPFPFLEWSIYILLIFTGFVAAGIFLSNKRRNGQNEPLSSLLGDSEPEIHCVGPEVSVTDCVRRMNDEKIGAMLVMDHHELLGIFTERDAITKVLGKGLEPSLTRVSNVMTENPICVSPSTTLDEAMTIVSSQRIRHLPVTRDGRVLGMVSSGDLTHRLVADQSGEIQELVDIASGGGGPQ